MAFTLSVVFILLIAFVVWTIIERLTRKPSAEEVINELKSTLTTAESVKESIKDLNSTTVVDSKDPTAEPTSPVKD